MANKKKGAGRRKPRTRPVQTLSEGTATNTDMSATPTSADPVVLDASGDTRNKQDPQTDGAAATPPPDTSPDQLIATKAPGLKPEIEGLPRCMMERAGHAAAFDKAVGFYKEYKRRHGRKELTQSATKALARELGEALWRGATWYRAMQRIFKKDGAFFFLHNNFKK